MFGNTKFLDYELTLDNIYRYISQYEIYRYYCGEFEVNKRISSPIRKDRNPSFAIQLYGGTWFWKEERRKRAKRKKGDRRETTESRHHTHNSHA